MNPKDNFIQNLSKKITNFSLAPTVTPSKPVVNQSFPMSPNGATSPNMTMANQNMSKPPITTPAPVVKGGTNIVTPEKQVLSPDAKNFANYLYDTKTGARTEYGASMGVQDMLGGKPVTPTAPTTPTTPTPTPTQPENPYQKYLNSFNERQSEELLRNRQRDEELRKNEIGQLERGQSYQLGEEQRLSNRSLADLAIAKAPTLDLFNQFEKQNAPIEVGGQLYQKQSDGTYKSVAGGAGAEGFTLGKDQVRYDAKGNIIASGTSSGAGGGEAPTIKTFGQSDYAWNPETSEWDPVQLSDISPQLKIDKAQDVIDMIKTLGKDAEGFTGAVGAKGIASLFGLKGKPIAGTKEAGYLSRLNQLTGKLTLENMGIMKGVLSDADIKIIKEASTALNNNISEEDFVTELGKLEKIMQKVIDKGGAMDSKISADEETYLRSQGYTDAEINSLKGSVGKTSASNIPQTNKNPGNVKKGGLADSLAVGVDKQGHLIFPDEETGFKALAMDVQAKIDGKSKYLPANPTVAQLGKVYAEDPNWSKSVAKILGVSTLTPTKQIPINNLIQAIARQEGYFA